jgi:hypothetical protein
MALIPVNHIVPTYRQNISTSNNPFAARPLKHWRKQYQNLLGFSRAAVGMPMDRPGGLVSSADACKTCRGAFPVKVDVFADAICTSCQPITNKTALSDTRYTDNKAYLQARGITYTQNEYIGLPGQFTTVPKTTVTFQNGPPNYGTQPIAWSAINIVIRSTGQLIFTGYFAVNTATTVIQNFYYINNNQYVDILLPLSFPLNGSINFGADNKFVNNNFTYGGTNIQPVIPYMNTRFNNPSRLQIFFIGNQNSLAYKQTAANVSDWTSLLPSFFTFTFTSIPPLQPFTTSVCTNAGSQFATVYKPSNSQFAQQGGVSSSARLARLKYNTLNNKPVVNNGVTVNGSVFNTAAGAMGLNSGLYQLEPTSGYYTKFKPQASVCHSRNGNKSYCPQAVEDT